jgi:hypothetical protein
MLVRFGADFLAGHILYTNSSMPIWCFYLYMSPLFP